MRTRPLAPRGSLWRTLAPRYCLRGLLRLDIANAAFCASRIVSIAENSCTSTYRFLKNSYYSSRVSADPNCASQGIQTYLDVSWIIKVDSCASFVPTVIPAGTLLSVGVASCAAQIIIDEASCASVRDARPLAPRGSLWRTLAPRYC